MSSTAIISTALLELVRNNATISEIAHLLRSGADPNFRDVLDGSTCLHHASANSNLAVMELLLENGADPNLVTQNVFASPLGVAALAGQLSAVRLLVANNARLSEHEVKTGLVQECREIGDSEIGLALESTLNQRPK